MNLPLLAVSLLVLLLSCLNAFSPTSCDTRHHSTYTGTRDGGTPTARHMVSGGFSFTDGDQVLVSVQKPLGLVLEQDANNGPILVTEVDPTGSAGRAGVQAGDVLVAVQNASVETVDLHQVLGLIGQLPRVVNLRFVRV